MNRESIRPFVARQFAALRGRGPVAARTAILRPISPIP